MRAIIIATFCNTSLGKENITGYRLLRLPDKETDIKWDMEISDVSEYQLSCVMINKQLDVVNATIKNNKIHGTDGQLSRYPKLDAKTKQIIGKAPLIILKQIKTDDTIIGYMVSDFKGTIVKASLADVIKYANTNGIANGKLVQRDNRLIISSINGVYETLKTPNTPKPDKRREKKKETTEFKKITMDEFRKLMGEGNYRYSVIGTTLCSIDDNVKELIIPDGITCIGNLKQTIEDGGSDVSNIEIIHIPKTVWSYNYKAFDGLKNLKKIYLDPDLETLDMDEFFDCGVDKIHKLPDNVEVIRWFGARCETSQLPITDFSPYKKLRRLDYAFQNIDITMPINLEPVEELIGCFSHGSSTHPIKIGPSVKTLQGTLHNGDYTEIDFSEATNLEDLAGNCLSSIKGLKKLDFSNCVNLTTIGYGCIRDLPDLEELILPPNLKKIGDSSISKCPKLTHLKLPDTMEIISQGTFQEIGITELEVPQGLISASFFNQNLVLKPANTKVLQSRVYGDSAVKQIILKDTIREFRIGALIRLNCEVNIPSALEKIGNNVFFGYRGGDELDFSHCKNLKSIGESAFEHAELSSIILSDSVVSIDNNAFKDTSKLSWIYIPKTVKSIGKSLFRGAGSRSPQRFIVYTQQNSDIDKYCKRNHIKICYVDNADEAKLLNESDESDAKRLSKLRLLLSTDPLHSVLFNDEYIQRAPELYKLYSDLTHKIEWNKLNSIKLNNTKLTSIPLEKIVRQEDIELYSNTDTHTGVNMMAFISLINYITRISENYNGLLVPELFDYMRKSGYINEDKSEILCSITYNGEVYNISEIPGKVDGERFQLMLVTKGDNIIYCTACNKYYECNVAKPIRYEVCKQELVRKPIDESITVGNTYKIGYGYGSSTLDIPNYISKELVNAFSEQTILIGCKVIKKNAFKYGDGSAIVYLLSCLTDRIIKGEARCTDIDPYESMEYRQIQTINVQGIYDWSELTEDDIQIIKESYFNNKKLGPVMQKIVYGDNYLDKIKKAQGAYDEPTACYEWELSKALKEAKISKIEHISKSGFDLIFDTPFFVKTRKKLSDLQKLQISKQFTLNNGEYELITFIYSSKRSGYSDKLIGYNYKYISIILDNSKVNTSTVECYIHSSNIEPIISKLKSIYNPNAKKAYVVTNEQIDLDDYEIIGKTKKCIMSYSTMEYSHDAALAINKATGIVYLLCGEYKSLFKPIDGTAAYQMFRFRNLREAVSATHWIYNDNGEFVVGQNKYDINDALSYAANKLAGRSLTSNKDDTLFKVRELIINGYPNGYSLGGYEGAMFNLIAKQPSKS